MEIFLAGTKTYVERYYLDPQERERVDVYMAGLNGRHDILMPTVRERSPKILESFAYPSKYTDEMLRVCDKFLLDSGAFSYLAGKDGSAVDWENYIHDYADFIKTHGISTFFELDIDPIVGYDRVKELRDMLARETDTQPIPVWHKSRGMDEFKRMCEDYDYVAVGGIVTREITPAEYPKLATLIEYAHKKDARIHGLGFTSMKWLGKIKFDSVDSTGWLSGTRFKGICKFNGQTIVKLKVTDNMRISDPKALSVHNFLEWCKFGEYAERYL